MLRFRKGVGRFEVRKDRCRVYVESDGDYDYDETVATLSRIFGIVGICPVELHEDEGFDKLCEAVIEHINHVYKDKSFTFKVNARRARKNYPMTSMEINAAVGEKVLEAFPETRVIAVGFRVWKVGLKFLGVVKGACCKFYRYTACHI